MGIQTPGGNDDKVIIASRAPKGFADAEVEAAKFQEIPVLEGGRMDVHKIIIDIKERLQQPVERGEMVHLVHIIVNGVENAEDIERIGFPDLWRELKDDELLNETAYVYCYDAETPGVRGISIGNKEDILLITGPIGRDSLKTSDVTVYPLKEFFDQMVKKHEEELRGETIEREELLRRESSIRVNVTDLARTSMMCDEAVEFMRKTAQENDGIEICFQSTIDALGRVKKESEENMGASFAVVEGFTAPFRRDLEQIIAVHVNTYYPAVKLPEHTASVRMDDRATKAGSPLGLAEERKQARNLLIMIAQEMAKIPYGFRSMPENDEMFINKEDAFTDDPEDFARILTVGVLHNLAAARKFFSLKGPKWDVLSEPQKFNLRSRSFDKRKINKYIGFQCDERLMAYHIIRGANNAVGHPERNPLNSVDRAATFVEMKQWAEGHREDDRDYQFGTFEEGIEQIFKAADTLFVIPKEEPKQSAKTPKKTASKAPSAPKTPEEFTSFDELEAFLLDHKKLKREVKRKQATRLDQGIREDKKACEDYASIGDVKGLIHGIGNIRTVQEIKGCHVCRENPDTSTVAYVGNVACHGYFSLDIDGKPRKLKWDMDANGEIVVEIGGQTYGRSDFVVKGKKKKKSHALPNFYQEMRRIILHGLKRHLVAKASDRRAKSHIDDNGCQSTDVPVGGKNNDVKLRVRKNQLFHSSEGSNGTEEQKKLREMAEETFAVLDKIRRNQDVTAEEAEALRVFVQITTTFKGEHMNLPIPVDPIEALSEIKRGNLTLDDVFIGTTQDRRKLARAGYSGSNVDVSIDDELEILRVCRQNEPDPETEKRRAATEAALGIKFSDKGLEDKTKVTINKRDPEVEDSGIVAVMIGTKEEVARCEGSVVFVDDMARWAVARDAGRKPEEEPGMKAQAIDLIHDVLMATAQEVDEESGETRYRVNQVILNAVQNKQFRRIKLTSLTESRELLTA